MTTAAAAVLQRVRRTRDDRVICGQLRTADTTLSRVRGLIGRSGLERDEGLFIATNSIHMLFMRFPIDALFLSAPDAHGDRTVVAIRPDLPPWRGVVWYVRGAKAVIELPAGTLAEREVRLGDTVALEDLDAAPALIADAEAHAA